MSLLILLASGNSLAEQKNISRALTAAREAGLSEDEINRILAYGYDVRISTDNAIELLEILTDARSHGFFIDPFLDKIDEGLAKRVSFEILKAVLRKKVRDYLFVLNLYRENNRMGDSKQTWLNLQQAADSVDMGLSYEDIRALFKGISGVPTEMYAIAAGNMALLKQLTFDPDLSLHLMRTGLTHGSLDPDWKNFFKAAAAAKQKGISEQTISAIAEKMLAEHKDFKTFVKALEAAEKNK